MAQPLQLINNVFEDCKRIFHNQYRPNNINQGGVKAHWSQLTLRLTGNKDLSGAINPPHLQKS